MRVRTELSEMPPAFTVVRTGEMADITFYSDIQADARGEEIVYSATAWTATFPWASTLQTRIEESTEVWRAKVEEKCTNEAAERIRSIRDALLRASDASVALDRLGLEVPMGSAFASWLSFLTQLGNALMGQWAIYRQRLRDIPQQEGFPFNVVWPTKPDE